MAEVHIVRHNPGAVFCNPCEVITIDDDHKRIEHYCHDICIFTLDLRYDIVSGPGGYERGPYYDVLRKNIEAIPTL